jgi:hypothetical protein
MSNLTDVPEIPLTALEDDAPADEYVSIDRGLPAPQVGPSASGTPDWSGSGAAVRDAAL